ncbi:MAG: PAS domain S-box protein [Spirochaetales bacterium]|nr:PAS domain S-box protein [Spirochaetales bacterium]MCF7938167.1 PAS domain S-box protein [Spirochaetales bacterium]
MNEKILLVEDDVISSAATAKMMEKYGYRIERCYGAAEAITAALKDEEILLVLMDIELGTEMDGIDAAEQILCKREIPLIFLTNYADGSRLERARNVSNYGYLLKDSGEFILMESVAMALLHYRERKEQEQIRHSLQYHSDLLEQMSEAVIATDNTLNIISWNRAAGEIYGWKEEEVLGLHVDHLLESEFLDISQEEAQRTLKEKGVWQGDLKQKRKDGETVYVEAAVSPVKDRDGNITGGVTVNRDITEKLRLQKHLELQRDMLVHCNRLDTIEEIAQTVLEYTMSIEPVEGAVFFLHNEESREFHLLAHRGLRSSWIERIGVFSDDNPLTHSLMESRKPLFGAFEDFFADSGYEDMKDSIKAFALIPLVQGEKLVGSINFCAYSRDTFQDIDRTLMESIGPWIGDIIQKKRSEEQVYRMNRELELQTKELEEVNTTLKVLVRNMEKEQREKIDSLKKQMYRLVMPLLESLKKIVTGERASQLVSVLKENLDSVLVEGRGRKMTGLERLTSRELQIASLLRESKSSKEIADILGVSVHSVFFHRKNIRKKLGLQEKGANLVGHLQK